MIALLWSYLGSRRFPRQLSAFEVRHFFGRRIGILLGVRVDTTNLCPKFEHLMSRDPPHP